jgi:hypothetical protein
VPRQATFARSTIRRSSWSYDREAEIAETAQQIRDRSGGDSFLGGQLPDGCTPPRREDMPYGDAFAMMSGRSYAPGTPALREPVLGLSPDDGRR